jgi:hypothetical protein
MFTDKFIPFPVKEFSDKEKELTGKENCREECVTVILKSGYTIGVYLSLEEFEKRLNEHK